MTAGKFKALVEESIFALATAKGRAGVAVVRVSGPAAGETIRLLTQGPLADPRVAALRWLHDPVTGDRLDQGLVLWFPGPASFTGEDVAEFHIHGGRAVAEGVLAAIGQVAGVRPAEAGEFTRRAFDNGRIDLTEAEGLADLVDAETEAQRRQALRQMEGHLGTLYEGWRKQLLDCLAVLEAGIDFAEEDLPEDLADRVTDKVRSLSREISTHLEDGWRGERLRDGLQIAILGAPNAGKSTLLNAMARRDVAIVSEIAGTTRDVIEVHLNLGGFAVTVADTAGIRDARDVVEAEGVRRSKARAERADLKIVVVDSQDGPSIPAGATALIDAKTLIVINKVDSVEGSGKDCPEAECALGLWRLSAKTGAGLDEFLADLTSVVAEMLGFGAEEAPRMTRERHRRALKDVVAHLTIYLAETGDVELKAEDIRLAARALGRITGLVDVEDVLGRIFSEFCIGK